MSGDVIAATIVILVLAGLVFVVGLVVGGYAFTDYCWPKSYSVRYVGD